MSISTIFRRYALWMFLGVPLCAQTPVAPIIQPHMVFNNAAGAACNACSLYSYVAGTTTPLATYTDSTAATQNQNPVITGADGGPLTPSGSSGAIWLATGSSYKLVLIDAQGNTVFTVDNVKGGGGISPCGPAYAIQAANSAVNGLTCDSSITINTSLHAISVGTLPASHVTIGALGTPTTWTFDTTTPLTALESLGGTSNNSGTINQLAYYAAAGTTLSGTSSIPVGITGTTQSPGDNTAKLATTAYVALPGPIAPSSLTVASGTAMTGNQGNGAKVQHSTGTVTTGDFASFDANGNIIDSTIQAPITGTLAMPSSSPIASDSCTSYTATMSSSVPAGKTVVISIAQGAGPQSGNGGVVPHVEQISGATVTINMCNNWTNMEGWNAATYNLTVVP